MTILIVFYAALFPLLLNTWSGVRAVNPIWLRAAGAMGATEHALFWKVIIPGASPFIITGLRQSFLRAWVAVIGAEMLAASNFGLGWVIFDAKEFLNADVMLASLVVIGFIGFITERLIFGLLERATIYRWGMAGAAKSYNAAAVHWLGDKARRLCFERAGKRPLQIRNKRRCPISRRAIFR